MVPDTAQGKRINRGDAPTISGQWKAACSAATRPDDELKPQRPKEKEKETGRGGGIVLIKPGPLKQASAGRAPGVKLQAGRAIIGLATAAARTMDAFARAMKETFLSPQQLALDREQERRESAERQAKAELADRLRTIDDWYEEQRRRLLEQQQEIEQRRRPCAAFANVAKAVTAPEIPGYLREFFEAHSGPNNLCDLSNPDRSLLSAASDSAVYDAGYSANGPSLDLG